MPEKILKDLLPNKVYNVQVRAVADETDSEWSPVLKVDTAALIRLYGDSGMNRATLHMVGRTGGWSPSFADKVNILETWPAAANSSHNVKMLSANKVRNHHAVELFDDGYYSPTGAYWQLYTEAFEVPYSPGKRYTYANGGTIEVKLVDEPTWTIGGEVVPGGKAMYYMAPMLIAVAKSGANKGKYLPLDAALPAEFLGGGDGTDMNTYTGIKRTLSIANNTTTAAFIPDIDEVVSSLGPVRIFNVYTLSGYGITSPGYIYGPTTGDSIFQLNNIRVQVS